MTGHEEAVQPVTMTAMDVADADHSGEESDELSPSSPEDGEGHGVVRNRRGIRLKQNFD